MTVLAKASSKLLSAQLRTARDQPLLSSNRRPNLRTYRCLGKDKKMVMGLDGVKTKKDCWQSPAANYCSAQNWQLVVSS
jgi:hypothetical protein